MKLTIQKISSCKKSKCVITFTGTDESIEDVFNIFFTSTIKDKF